MSTQATFFLLSPVISSALRRRWRTWWSRYVIQSWNKKQATNDTCFGCVTGREGRRPFPTNSRWFFEWRRWGQTHSKVTCICLPFGHLGCCRLVERMNRQGITDGIVVYLSTITNLGKKVLLLSHVSNPMNFVVGCPRANRKSKSRTVSWRWFIDWHYRTRTCSRARSVVRAREARVVEAIPCERDTTSSNQANRCCCTILWNAAWPSRSHYSWQRNSWSLCHIPHRYLELIRPIPTTNYHASMVHRLPDAGFGLTDAATVQQLHPQPAEAVETPPPH